MLRRVKLLPKPNSLLVLSGLLTEIGFGMPGAALPVKLPSVEKKNISYTPDEALSVIAKYTVPLVKPSPFKSIPALPCGVNEPSSSSRIGPILIIPLFE